MTEAFYCKMADFLTIVAEPGLVCLAKSGISCAELGMRATDGSG
jgi:hypothetical protein